MSVIDDYLNKVDEPQRAALERVRQVIKNAVPEAEDAICWGMPGFRYKKKYLMAFSPFKDHMSVFPGAAPIEALKDKLAAYETTKGTVHFTVDQPLPESIIKELVAVRISQIDK